MPVHPSRLRAANQGAVRRDGAFVLYWCVATRRTRYNAGLERAAGWARELGRPLVVLEALRAGYPWASDRLHGFVIQGMAANARALAEKPVLYLPYLEPAPGAGRGLLEALGRRACVVVTDRFPGSFLPSMVAAAAGRLAVLCEEADSNGLLPLAASSRDYPSAYAFRRHLQRSLPAHLLEDLLAPDPLARLEVPRLAAVPEELTGPWAPTPVAALEDPARLVAGLPIDHGVAPTTCVGGSEAAAEALEGFLRHRLASYGELHNHPDEAAASGLSPWLHFGHLAAQEVFERVADHEQWTPEHLGPQRAGKRAGFWGMGESAESFLDELVTWRELGYHFAAHRPDHAEYASLPEWARTTLGLHAGDRRDPCYELERFREAATHDELWNAAQRELREEGRIQNYLRMLWGKKILHWSASPQEALAIMVELNNRYALDGRDPNSFSGIFWVLGRFDRPWGPERPVFGKIRYMTSDSTRRKLRLEDYLQRWGHPG